MRVWQGKCMGWNSLLFRIYLFYTIIIIPLQFYCIEKRCVHCAADPNPEHRGGGHGLGPDWHLCVCRLGVAGRTGRGLRQEHSHIMGAKHSIFNYWNLWIFNKLFQDFHVPTNCHKINYRTSKKLKIIFVWFIQWKCPRIRNNNVLILLLSYDNNTRNVIFEATKMGEQDNGWVALDDIKVGFLKEDKRSNGQKK